MEKASHPRVVFHFHLCNQAGATYEHIRIGQESYTDWDLVFIAKHLFSICDLQELEPQDAYMELMKLNANSLYTCVLFHNSQHAVGFQGISESITMGTRERSQNIW